MNLRSLRERRLLSQERLAEMSGLSLRTIQRLEAGHRVSYASLRSLAATLEIDVDLLERDLYAVNKSTDDFVEIPRWVRLLNDGSWLKDVPRPSRRDAHIIEAMVLGLGIVVFALSFVVTQDVKVQVLRYAAVVELAGCYLISVFIRIIDTYKLWPATDIAFGAPRPPSSSWLTRNRVIGYTAYLVAPILLMVVLFLLAYYFEI